MTEHITHLHPWICFCFFLWHQIISVAWTSAKQKWLKFFRELFDILLSFGLRADEVNFVGLQLLNPSVELVQPADFSRHMCLFVYSLFKRFLILIAKELAFRTCYIS